MAVEDLLQLVGGNVAGREHPVERAVVVEDGDGGDAGIPHRAPGQIQRHGLVQLRGLVKVQIGDLGAHILYVHGRLEPEAVQHTLGLVVDRADADGLVFPVAQGVAQIGVGHGGDDGVGIGIAVSADIDVVHDDPPKKSDLCLILFLD